MENEGLKIAIHCLGVQADEEVCEECPAYQEGGVSCREAARVAIAALREIQQYRKIGTVEECREAVLKCSKCSRRKWYQNGYEDADQKQKPKKPTDFDGDYGYFVCPSCGCTIMADRFKDHKYCLNCGQKLNWE